MASVVREYEASVYGTCLQPGAELLLMARAFVAAMRPSYVGTLLAGLCACWQSGNRPRAFALRIRMPIGVLYVEPEVEWRVRGSSLHA